MYIGQSKLTWDVKGRFFFHDNEDGRCLFHNIISQRSDCNKLLPNLNFLLS